VENFCGEIFGKGSGEELAKEMGLEFLGRIQMKADYLDTSKPTVLNSNAVLEEFRHIASGVQSGLAEGVEAD
jgi:hypothetical protein